MNTQLAGGDSPAENEIRPEHVLAEWNKAIIDVHKNYSQLSRYIDGAASRQKQRRESGRFIGQCPVDQLKKLVTAIHNELERLIQDMNQFGKSEPSAVQKQYKKLAGHTLILNQLNQQAQTSLRLLTLSPS